LKAVVTVSDLIEGRDILKKRYEAPKRIIRALAHSISNDVFRVVTGKRGVFRSTYRNWWMGYENVFVKGNS